MPKILILVLLMMITSGCAKKVTESIVREDQIPNLLDLPTDETRQFSHTPGSWVLDKTSNTLTLDSVMQSTLENNPQLIADFLRFEALLQRSPQARSLPDPMVMFTYFVDGVQTRTGEQQYMVALSQKFPWFGKLTLRGKLKDAEAQAALENFRTHVLDRRREVQQAYHKLVFQHASLELAREERIYMEQFLQTASTDYSTGRRGRQSMLKAQTELARIDNQLLAFPAYIDTLHAKLNRLMGRAADQPLSAPQETSLAVADLSAVEFLPQALSHRPELARLDRLIEKSEVALALAHKDYWPDLTLGVNYIGIGSRPDNPKNSPSDEADDAWGLTFGMNLPLPNARRRAQKVEAQKLLEEALVRRQAQEDRVREDLQAASSSVRRLEDGLLVFEDSLLPLAQETFVTSQSEYISGDGNFLDLLDAERTLLRVRRDYLAQIRDYWIALADLERATGTRIDVQKVPVSD